MQVTLRKGKKLADALIAAGQAVNHITQLSIPLYAVETKGAQGIATLATESALAGQSRLSESVARAVQLLEMGYRVRGQLGEAFSSSGISKVLTEKALIEKQLQVLGGVVKSTRIGTLPSEAGALAAALNARASSQVGYGRNVDDVTVRVASDALAEGFEDTVHKLKRRLVEIDDALLHLNLATKITLAPDVVSALESNKLV